jgi:POT family proton-dependent oligopeptide transporter
VFYQHYFWQMVQNHDAVSWALKMQVISFVYIVYYAITHLDGKARHQLMALPFCVLPLYSGHCLNKPIPP